MKLKRHQINALDVALRRWNLDHPGEVPDPKVLAQAPGLLGTPATDIAEALRDLFEERPQEAPGGAPPPTSTARSHDVGGNTVLGARLGEAEID